jgi:hypothetical protein
MTKPPGELVVLVRAVSFRIGNRLVDRTDASRQHRGASAASERLTR